jgi:hypothetical protein
MTGAVRSREEWRVYCSEEGEEGDVISEERPDMAGAAP